MPATRKVSSHASHWKYDGRITECNFNIGAMKAQEITGFVGRLEEEVTKVSSFRFQCNINTSKSDLDWVLDVAKSFSIFSLDLTGY